MLIWFCENPKSSKKHFFLNFLCYSGFATRSQLCPYITVFSRSLEDVYKLYEKISVKKPKNFSNFFKNPKLTLISYTRQPSIAGAFTVVIFCEIFIFFCNFFLCFLFLFNKFISLVLAIFFKHKV